MYSLSEYKHFLIFGLMQSKFRRDQPPKMSSYRILYEVVAVVIAGKSSILLCK